MTTEKITLALTEAGLNQETIDQRLTRVEGLKNYESYTRGFSLWCNYGKVRIYFSITGQNKNNQAFVDLVEGKISYPKPSMSRACQQINSDAGFNI